MPQPWIVHKKWTHPPPHFGRKIVSPLAMRCILPQPWIAARSNGKENEKVYTISEISSDEVLTTRDLLLTKQVLYR